MSTRAERRWKQWRRRRNARLALAWLLLVAIAVAAIVVDQLLRASAERKGIAVPLVLVLLALVALLIPSVSSALGRVTKLKTAGFEVGLATSRDATTELTKLSPDDPAPRRARLIDPQALPHAEGSIELLRDRLAERLEWVYRNLPRLGSRLPEGRAAIVELRKAELLTDSQALILDQLLSLRDDEIDAARRRAPNELEAFLRAADALVYRLRTVVLDTEVRALERAATATVIDWRPQQANRTWPDHLAVLNADLTRRCFWVSVRVEPEVIKRTHKRLADDNRRAEVPGGETAIPLVVVPEDQAALAQELEGVEVVPLSRLAERLTRR